MKRLFLILSLVAFTPLLNSCVGKSDEDLRRTYLPEEKRVPVVIRSSGKLTFQRLKHSIVATIHRSDQPTISIPWPEGVPCDEQAEVETLDEKWQGGKTFLLRVNSNGKTVHDASLCEKHHVQMVRQVEQVVDGGEYPQSQFEDGHPKLFPNDGKAYLLCGSGIRWTVWRCPSCYEGSERWRKRLGISL